LAIGMQLLNCLKSQASRIGQKCYELLSTPSIFPFYSNYSTLTTTCPALPIVPNPSEEDIANNLAWLYADLTHFLTSYQYTSNTNQPLQPNGACSIGSMPHPCLILSPNYHSYPDSQLLADMDQIVTLPD
jgi:hypothetical protein